MGFGVFQHRIQLLQLDPSIFRREAPAYLGLPSVPLGLPRLDFTPQRGHFFDATVEALARQDAQFGLRPVQLTAMLGGVVELQPVPEPLGLGGR